MALTDIFVDPSLASDTGAGTVGDPYGDLEYAIEQETFDTTNGTRVNIKAGTDEILAASLQTALADVSVSIAWVPTISAQLVFQGYTAAAQDGGVGGITGSGTLSIMNDAILDYVHFVDLHLHNCGANKVLDLDNNCSVIRCEIDNATGGGIALDAFSVVSENYVHNVSASGIDVNSGLVSYNFLQNGTNDFTDAIVIANIGTLYRNIISVDGASNGMQLNGNPSVINNAIYANAGTGRAIYVPANKSVDTLANNVVEGFSGAGGIGFDLDATGVVVRSYGGNAAYSNTTDYTSVTAIVDNLGDNETLTASPFTDAANGDFSPVDTGNIKEGSSPTIIGGGLV